MIHEEENSMVLPYADDEPMPEREEPEYDKYDRNDLDDIRHELGYALRETLLDIARARLQEPK